MTALESLSQCLSPWPPSARSVWLVGAGGSGMRALGEFFEDADWTVFRTDADWSVRGVTLVDRPPRDVDLVIRSAAVASDAAVLSGRNSVTYPEALAAISRATPTVAVAGTHGKTTTSVLLSHALGGSRIVGGVGLADNRSGRFVTGSTQPVVVEACEYRSHFLNLRPSALCVLNLEWDHPDAFASEADVERAFASFLSAQPQASAGVVHVGVNDRLRRPSSLATFSRARHNGYWPADVRLDGSPSGSLRFDLMRGDDRLGMMTVPCLPANYVDNAVAAAATAIELGRGINDVVAGMAAYRGVERRFQIRAFGETIVVDDYAHHPTAVSATLAEARSRWPERPLVVAFEPHQLGRLRAFEDEFVASLAAADEVIVAPVFAAREPKSDGTDVARFVSRLGLRGKAAASLDQVGEWLETRRKQQPRTVQVILGAGHIGRILDERLDD